MVNDRLFTNELYRIGGSRPCVELTEALHFLFRLRHRHRGIRFLFERNSNPALRGPGLVGERGPVTRT